MQAHSVADFFLKKTKTKQNIKEFVTGYKFTMYCNLGHRLVDKHVGIVIPPDRDFRLKLWA